MIAGATVGGLAGGVIGALAQSGLARLGPVGATLGLLARPMLGFLGLIMGMEFGKGLFSGNMSLKESLDNMISSFDPWRDLGQASGASLGGIIGVALSGLLRPDDPKESSETGDIAHLAPEATAPEDRFVAKTGPPSDAPPPANHIHMDDLPIAGEGN